MKPVRTARYYPFSNTYWEYQGISKNIRGMENIWDMTPSGSTSIGLFHS
jgi:hypothetical protein